MTDILAALFFILLTIIVFKFSLLVSKKIQNRIFEPLALDSCNNYHYFKNF